MITVGIIAACFVINARQGVIATLLKKLIRSEAFGEENAKSLRDLGLDKNGAVVSLLAKKEGYIKKLVKRVGDCDCSEKTAEQNAENGSSDKKSQHVSEKCCISLEKDADFSTEEAANATEVLEAAGENTISDGGEEAPLTDAICDMEGDTKAATDSTGREEMGDDCAQGLYYIPNDAKTFAFVSLEKNNSSVLKSILFAALVLGFSLAAIFAMPSLLELFKG